MATVEIQTGTHVKRYEFWSPETWAIPKLYWDAFSQEQRIHAICRQLAKVIAYADYISVNVDDIAQRLQDIEDGKLDDFIVSAIETWFEENQPAIMQTIENLQTDIAGIDSKIGEGFDSEHTVSNAITNVDSKFGTGFDTENTVSNAITGVDSKFGTGFDAENTVSDAITDVRTDFTNEIAELAKVLNVVDVVSPSYVGDFVYYNDKLFPSKATQHNCILVNGFCRISERYFVFAFTNDDDSYAKFGNADNEQNTYRQYAASWENLGHANGLAYNDSNNKYYLYTDAVYDHIVVFNSAMNTIETKINTPNAGVYGTIAYDKITRKMFYIEYSGAIYEFNYTNNTFTYLRDLEEPVTQIGTGQNVAIYNNIAFFPMSTSGSDKVAGLKAYNLADGSHLKNVSIDMSASIYGYGEMEDADFDYDGNLYICSRYTNSRDAKYIYAYQTIVYKCNPFTGDLAQYDYEPDTQFRAECSNYTGFVSKGTSANPFKDILEINNLLHHKSAKRVFMGLNSDHSTSLEQEWTGMLITDKDSDITLHFNGSNNINIVGMIMLRGGTTLRIQNACRLRSCQNPPENYLFLVDNSTLLAGGIYGFKTYSNNISNTLKVAHTAMVNITGLQLDGASNTPQTENLTGYGYVIGSPHTGS